MVEFEYNIYVGVSQPQMRDLLCELLLVLSRKLTGSVSLLKNARFNKRVSIIIAYPLFRW